MNFALRPWQRIFILKAFLPLSLSLTHFFSFPINIGGTARCTVPQPLRFACIHFTNARDFVSGKMFSKFQSGFAWQDVRAPVRQMKSIRFRWRRPIILSFIHDRMCLTFLLAAIAAFLLGLIREKLNSAPGVNWRHAFAQLIAKWRLRKRNKMNVFCNYYFHNGILHTHRWQRTHTHTLTHLSVERRPRFVCAVTVCLCVCVWVCE